MFFMILLDTSFLYAYFQRKDVHHKEALKLAGQLDGEQAGVPLEVLEELLTVITRKVSSEEAVRVGKTLITQDNPLQIIYPNEAIFYKTWELFRALSPHHFSMADCVLMTLADHFECEVFTFDRALEEELKG